MPGCVTQGETYEEALTMAESAVSSSSSGRRPHHPAQSSASSFAVFGTAVFGAGGSPSLRRR